MSQDLVGYGNGNYPPNTGGSRSNRRRKDKNAIKYIVTDPNDVQFTEQGQEVPTVTQQGVKRNFIPLEKPGQNDPPTNNNSGEFNSGFVEEEEPASGLTAAERSRIIRRSRRRERQRQKEASLSPDTSSEDVIPHMTSQPAPKKGIIKDSRSSTQEDSFDHSQITGEKYVHLKKCGDDGYGFAYRNGRVSVVKEGSEAERAGLQVGDKILSVNGVSTVNKNRDDILRDITKNKKNLIMVVLDETVALSSDCNESGSGSEMSDVVDRSSGSSVRFHLAGRPTALKPGESVASLDVIPAKTVVNYNPYPQPNSRKKRPRHGSSGHQQPGQHRSHRQHHSQSPHRSSRHQSPGRRSMDRNDPRRRSGGSQSRSGGSQSRRSRSGERVPQTNGHSTSSNRPSLGARNYAYDDSEHVTLDSTSSSVITEQPHHYPLYKVNDSSTTVNGGIQTPTDTTDQRPPVRSTPVDPESQKERKSMCLGSYRIWATLTLVFCLPCFPLGVLAFVYASRSSEAYENNEQEKGDKLGTTAGYFIAAGMMLGAMAWLGVIVGVAFAV